MKTKLCTFLLDKCKDETDKCYLIFDEDGYLSCTYNHTMGAKCLMKERK